MKKSNISLNKTIARKDLLNGLSTFTITLIFVFGILIFLGTLAPSVVNGKLALGLTQRVARGDELSYLFDCNDVLSLVSLALPFVIAILQFCFLHQKENCYTTLSFGIKRKNIYINRMLYPLIALLAIVLVVKGIALAINIKYIGFHVIDTWLVHVLIYFQIIIYTYSITVFCCHFCGRTIEAAAASLSAFVLPIGLTTLIDQVFSFSLFGCDPFTDTVVTKAINLLNPLPLTDLWTTAMKMVFDPSANLTGRTIVALFWTLFSVALLVFTGSYFRKKYKPEICGFKGAKTGIVYLISLCAPMFVSYFALDYVRGQFYPLNNDKVKLVAFICAFAFGVLGAVLVNFLIHFTFKRIKVALLSGVTIGAVIGLVFLVGFSGIFGTYNKLPEKEDIESIKLTAPFAGFIPYNIAGETFDDPYVATGDEITFTEPEEFQLVLDIHKAVLSNRKTESVSEFTVTYTLKNGERLSRTYTYLSNEVVEMLLKLWDTPSVKKLIKGELIPEAVYTEYDESTYKNNMNYTSSFTDSVIAIQSKTQHTWTEVTESLTSEQAFKLRDAVQKDILSFNYEEWFRPQSEYLGYIYFSTTTDRHYLVAPNYYANSFSYVAPVYRNMENTLKVLEELGLTDELCKAAEIEAVYVADLKEIVDWNDNYLKGADEKYITKPYFCHSAFVVLSKEDKKSAPVKKITDRAEIEKIVKNCYGYYLTGNDACSYVIVEFADDGKPGSVNFNQNTYVMK